MHLNPHFHRLLASLGIVSWVTLGCASCAPKRIALQSPFPLTYGGTTIPAKGVAGGVEFGDGLAGQEVDRTDTMNLNLSIGIADRVSVSVARYGEPPFLFSDEPFGSVWRVKVRLGELFGPRSSVSVHAGFATIDRKDLPAQQESLQTVDVAAPAEILLSDPAKQEKASVYVGPRVTRESYRDHLDPQQDMQHVYAGVLGGMHFSLGFLHVFSEATLLYVPRNTFHNVTYGGRLTVMPEVGILLRVGQDHKWKSR